MSLHRIYHMVLGACLVGPVLADQATPHPQSAVQGSSVQIRALDAPMQFISTADPASAEGEMPERLTVVGRPVQNLQGQPLGRVEDVLISADGRVQSVVLATGGLLGWGQQCYEVPWARVHWQRDGDYLTLDVALRQVEAEFSAFETD